MSSSQTLDAPQVMCLFNREFAVSDKTELIGGAAEPYYQPGSPHRIYFRADYLRSALHEVAHWCVAGRRRRDLPDYGYWYSPDGRHADQQQAFFTVEARPQAIERRFVKSLAYRSPRVSIMSACTSSLSSCVVSKRVFKHGAISLNAPVCRGGPPGLLRRCNP